MTLPQLGKEVPQLVNRQLELAAMVEQDTQPLEPFYSAILEDTTPTVLEAFDRTVGLPEAYDPVMMARILRDHYALVKKYSVSNSYLEIAGRGSHHWRTELPVEEKGQKIGTLVMSFGLVEAFSPGAVALGIEEQADIYIRKGTMGRQFPAQSQLAREELLAIMIGNYQPENRIKVQVVFESLGGEVVPIGGVDAYFGQNGQNKIGDLIQGRVAPADTSLSTFQALKIDMNAYASEFGKQHGLVLETEVVEMSRLWRRDDAELARHDINLKALGINSFPWQLMSLLGIAIDATAQEVGKEPQLVVFDTHADKIHQALAEIFRTVYLAAAGQAHPTELVLEGGGAEILRWHYGPSGQGGYDGEIVVGAASFPGPGGFLDRSQRFLTEKDSPLRVTAHR